jgi:hypothetical protein
MYSVNLNVRVDTKESAHDVYGYVARETAQLIVAGHDVSLSCGEVEEDTDIDSPTLQYSINRAFEISGLDFEVKEKLVSELLSLHVGFKHLEY